MRLMVSFTLLFFSLSTVQAAAPTIDSKIKTLQSKASATDQKIIALQKRINHLEGMMEWNQWNFFKHDLAEAALSIQSPFFDWYKINPTIYGDDPKNVIFHIDVYLRPIPEEMALFRIEGRDVLYDGFHFTSDFQEYHKNIVGVIQTTIDQESELYFAKKPKCQIGISYYIQLNGLNYSFAKYKNEELYFTTHDDYDWIHPER